MKNFTQYIFLVFISLILIQCVKEDFYEYSDRAEILNFQLQNQSGNAQIFSDQDSIFVEVANGVDLSQLTINTIKLSSFANSDLVEGDTVDGTDGSFQIEVTSENGTIKTWTIGVFEVGSQPQISNSDFNTWYNTGNYLDIGADDASSSWGTSNPGAVFGGIAANVVQVDLGNGNYAAQMITRYTAIGAVVSKPIAAGSLFTGDFMQDNISITDPEASIDFGIPFTAEPHSFSIDYQYTPGPNNINSHQIPLTYPDYGDMYAILERRDGDTVKRVATAWYRILNGNTEMETQTVDFIYGPLPAGTPDYMLPADGQSYASSDETPTHIIVVFTSSADGAIFQGAKNSTLTVDNFQLNY